MLGLLVVATLNRIVKDNHKRISRTALTMNRTVNRQETSYMPAARRIIFTSNQKKAEALKSSSFREACRKREATKRGHRKLDGDVAAYLSSNPVALCKL